MNTPSDKDYIDAKLQAYMERISAEAQARHAVTDARLLKLELEIEASSKLLRQEMNTRLAELEIRLLRSQQSMLKWIIGSMFAMMTISVSATSLVIVYVTPKASQPIILYGPPVESRPRSSILPMAAPPEATNVSS